MTVSTASPAIPSVELVIDDGEPLESDWHRVQMNLLIDLIRQAMVERGRGDYFAGGNMFIYYSVAQAIAVAREPPARTLHFRGPDVFWVDGAEPRDDRGAWVVWQEGGRYPDLIVELLSPKTAEVDRTTKKRIYERVFRTPDYFMYDPRTRALEGFRLTDGAYRAVDPVGEGRYPVTSLGLWLAAWRGPHKGVDTVWLRLFEEGGRMIPTDEERVDVEKQRADAEKQRADTEKQRADTEKQRADAAEAELRKLRGAEGGSGHRPGHGPG